MDRVITSLDAVALQSQVGAKRGVGSSKATDRQNILVKVYAPAYLTLSSDLGIPYKLGETVEQQYASYVSYLSRTHGELLLGLDVCRGEGRFVENRNELSSDVSRFSVDILKYMSWNSSIYQNRLFSQDATAMDLILDNTFRMISSAFGLPYLLEPLGLHQMYAKLKSSGLMFALVCEDASYLYAGTTRAAEIERL